MLRVVVALAAIFFASSATASVYRIEVTGDPGYRYGYEWAVDRQSDDWEALGSGSLTLEEIPEGTPGVRFRDAGAADTGSLTFSTLDRTFSDCAGMLVMACEMFVGSSVWWPEDPVIDTSAFNLFAAFNCCAGFHLTPAGFYYADDGTDTFTIGTITYGMAYPVFNATFSDVTVTELAIAPVPLPAGVWLLLAAMGFLAPGARGRRNRAGGWRPRQDSNLQPAP
jgi:hypothetical protein